jgi:DNA-binding NarL/FixJ family response regulator
VAWGRVLVVHESGATRALLSDLLTQEGLRVEGVETTYQAMVRQVDDPAELVILGLGGLDERELEFIPTLRREDPPPKVLVTFASPRRDLAVTALTMGATGYALEPFYGNEIVGLVRGQLRGETPAGANADAAGPHALIARLAHEIAHSIGNPLQIASLLLEKDKVTKRELTDGLPPNLARIDAVVRHLRGFANVPAAQTTAGDPVPVVATAAAKANVTVEGAGAGAGAGAGVPDARFDPALLAEALDGVFAAVRARMDPAAPLSARLDADGDTVRLRLDLPRATFSGETLADLTTLPFSVRGDRDVLPSLARPRALIDAMGGSLALEQRGERVVVAVRLSRAA